MAKPIGLTDEEVAAQEAPAKGMTDEEVNAQVTSAPQMAQHGGLPPGGVGTFEPASLSGTALRGFGQGASFGFTDELAGVARGGAAGFSRLGAEMAKSKPGRAAVRLLLKRPDLPDAVADMIIEGSLNQGAQQALGMKGVPLDLDQAASAGYRHGRDESRLENVQAEEANPGTFVASQVAGALAAPGPKFARAGTPGRMASVAKAGAAYGGAASLGQSRADLTRYENEPQAVMDAVGDTALGAGAGGVLAPLATVVGDRLGRALRTGSQNSALKAIGLRAGISDQLAKRGYETADEARTLGQRAMDMGLIRPFRTASDVAERARFAQEATGARIEGALADADAASLRPGAGFDAERGSWQAASNVMGPDGLSPTAIRESRRAQRLVEDVRRLPDVQPSTFRNANQLKSDMYAGINYGTDPALKTRLERRAAGGLRQSIEDQIAETAGPEVADELRAANAAYGHLSDIQPLAREEATRQLARKTLTAGDIGSAVMAGAGGTMAAGPGGAAAGLLPLGAKLLGPRIPSTMAAGQAALSPRIGPLLMGGARAALQPPMRPSVSQEEEDAIQAFLSSP